MAKILCTSIDRQDTSGQGMKTTSMTKSIDRFSTDLFPVDKRRHGSLSSVFSIKKYVPQGTFIEETHVGDFRGNIDRKYIN